MKKTTDELHAEMREGLEEDLEQELKRSKFNGRIMGVLIGLLILSFIFLNYGIPDVIMSLFSSTTIEGNTIFINETHQVIMTEGSYEELVAYYDFNLEQEFKACLIGEIKDKGKYVVNKLHIPKTSHQSFHRVVAERCPEGTIVDLHSQPYRKCLPSEQDFKTKDILKQDNADQLFVIMCEDVRFSIY